MDPRGPRNVAPKCFVGGECLFSWNVVGMFTQLKYNMPSNQPNDLNPVSPLLQTQYFSVALFEGIRVAETHSPPIQNQC